MSCLAHSLQNIHHVAFCAAVCLAGRGIGGASAAVLALALYVCPLTPFVLILPCAYLSFIQQCERGSRGEANQSVCDEYRRSKDGRLLETGFLFYFFRFTLVVIGLYACLLGASVASMNGRLDFVQASIFSVIAYKDLTPNVGIFWYLFVEVFDRYRLLFLVFFHGHLLFYVVPLHIRMGRHRPTGPRLQCSAAVAIICLFKPYPTASDYGLLLSVLLVQVEVIRKAYDSFSFLLSGMIFGLCMFSTMSAVWLTRNAGNANFLYNMTLVVNVFGCLLLTEWIRAAIKLRRREHLMAFCREVILDVAEKVLAGEASAYIQDSAGGGGTSS